MNVAQKPAQLFTGTKNQLIEHTEQFLQKNFCKNIHAHLSCFCNECRKIKNRQHENIIWIAPEKDYAVDDISIIFERIKFALAPNENFFFILENVQRFTLVTANRILKVLEEPTHGYHFILLATNAQALLPTIVSRCMLTNLVTNDTISEISVEQHPLLSFFSSCSTKKDPFSFEQELKKQTLNDAQSLELAQLLLAFFSTKLRACHMQAHKTKEEEHVTSIIEFLCNKMRKPPQSGSSELFWKNLFLNFPEKE